jgi:hypothetical protein
MKLRIFSENSEVPANSFIAGLLCALQNGSSFYSHTAAESEGQFSMIWKRAVVVARFAGAFL